MRRPGLQTVVVNANDLQTLTFYNRPSGGLQIIKSDEDTGARISGVKFEVRKINGEILGTYTTDRNGVISIPNAENGWYTITELKAADGYELDTTPVNAWRQGRRDHDGGDHQPRMIHHDP